MKKTRIITKSKKLHFGNNAQYYVLLAPFAIMFFLFTVLPVLSSIVLSFFDFDMIRMPNFIGIDNYIRMFVDDDTFGIVVKNTILFAIITGPIGFMLSFVLAWFLNEFKPFTRTILSFMFYAPALVGNGLFIWQIAFSNDSYGYMNSLLLSWGFINEPISWLKSEQYIMPIIIIVQLWQSMGVSFLANISGLQNINGEMYEAGAIDGIRNRWQELWFITLPSMKNMLLFSAVMQIASSFSISSIAVNLAGYPSVGHAADTIVSHIGDVGTVRYEMGYAAALSVFLFALMALTRKAIVKLLDVVGR
ncbi:MAG: sugar ABC transporter permease [Clostridia bacterium]|nr:sugar ABC transporter permease [Clostridia bacterium]